MPRQIKIVDVSFVYEGGGIPPTRGRNLQNNIVRDWNYCLFGEDFPAVLKSASRRPETQDVFCLSMRLTFTYDRSDVRSYDPAPWLDGTEERVKTRELFRKRSPLYKGNWITFFAITER